MAELREHKVKRLHMRSMRRGIKEMDLILPSYASTRLEAMDDAALALYEKAMGKAQGMNAKDHLSSIGLSMARLQAELGQTQSAISSLEAAKVTANKLEDKELKAEIEEVLEQLVEVQRAG
mgnify:CR=1 FL=1